MAIGGENSMSMSGLERESIPVATSGRTYQHTRRCRLDAVDRNGVCRLDALARYAQDVSSEDTSDSGLDRALGGPGQWLVARLWMMIERPPSLLEDLELITWCSGLGRSWAERRIRLRGSSGAEVEMAALWIQTNPGGRGIRRLDEVFLDIYAEAAQGRRVGARRAREPVDEAAVRRPWAIRATDIDLLDHVNNAASWAALEESRSPLLRRPLVAEANYVAECRLDDPVELAVAESADRLACWVVDEDGQVRTSFRVEALG